MSGDSICEILSEKRNIIKRVRSFPPKDIKRDTKKDANGEWFESKASECPTWDVQARFVSCRT